MERLTDREVQMSIEFLVGDEYSQIGEYTGVAGKMLMKHNVCGHEWGGLNLEIFRTEQDAQNAIHMLNQQMKRLIR